VPLAVTALAVPLALADLRHLRLPNVLTLAAYPVFAVAIGAAAGSGGQSLALRAALGALAFAGAHAVVHLLSPHSLGAGDVKLAGSLGAVLGSVGWAALVVGAGLAAVCTTVLAIVSVSKARFGRERFKRWSNCVPHGPGLLVATWLVALFPGSGGEAGLSG
jgi:leader peptidase (prepilin peptidase)/N-methyltransferase